jgi:hypothetical protein
MEITLPQEKTYADLAAAHEADMQAIQQDKPAEAEEGIYPTPQAQADNYTAYRDEVSASASLPELGKTISHLRPGSKDQPSEFQVRVGNNNRLQSLRDISSEAQVYLTHIDVLNHPDSYDSDEKPKSLNKARTTLYNENLAGYELKLLSAALDLVAQGDEAVTIQMVNTMEYVLEKYPGHPGSIISRQIFQNVLEGKLNNGVIGKMDRRSLAKLLYNF